MNFHNEFQQSNKLNDHSCWRLNLAFGSRLRRAEKKMPKGEENEIFTPRTEENIFLVVIARKSLTNEKCDDPVWGGAKCSLSIVLVLAKN